MGRQYFVCCSDDIENEAFLIPQFLMLLAKINEFINIILGCYDAIASVIKFKL